MAARRREITALWSLGALLFSPVTRENARFPAAAAENLPVVLPRTIRAVVTPDMKVAFEQCLEEMAQRIKVEFADQIVAYHPLFRTPIRVSDSRVTVEKIADKLREKTQSYVDQDGGVRIDLAWDQQLRQWEMNGWFLWWKDAQTGQMHRQYAKSLKELQKVVCDDSR